MLELEVRTAELGRIGKIAMFTELEFDVRITPDGALATATVRTDRLPAAFADTVVTTFAEAVRRGPEHGPETADSPSDEPDEDPSCAY
ncbi:MULTISPECIES: hypothetical protein [unclassified Streptomyces]|uniref:hypothetical protein n=1 Tax=unclassified Streptomyces TaxID=2593676 RepID=UPI0011AC3D73|nr:hypothetical protein [Streptomyces sp. BK340]TVZ80481.1 hypothetical protein FB157_12970 [Streptomyces sp. BK340]